ncbi:hypothetical protein BOS5A_200601 [Bosea sp. EC-HK365B]|nr:hypothetical protein BOSE21B_110551 [Bosea sp. 21B]CAD5279189.1 hypothetical protein BOSE7B_40666 [Bosea sp. 7B]VVT58469.1 hypothetical protein BOS5A_200601 [Bosea sp. EC-HK365B]VXC82556.1 hypothetical protein BOSE127_60064 [Bosea sp. 127]
MMAGSPISATSFAGAMPSSPNDCRPPGYAGVDGCNRAKETDGHALANGSQADARIRIAVRAFLRAEPVRLRLPALHDANL